MINLDVQLGQKVYIPELDKQGEVYEIHAKVKNLITKVKTINADGTIEIIEVAELAVVLVDTVGYILATKVFKKIKNFFTKLFKGKKNA